MPEPVYLFSDPFHNRHNEAKGRPGIVEEFADRLTPEQLKLNFADHLLVCKPEEVPALAEAVRSATDDQIEASRHLIAHALRSVGESLWSRASTLTGCGRDRVFFRDLYGRPGILSGRRPSDAVSAAVRELLFLLPRVAKLAEGRPNSEVAVRRLSEFHAAIAEAAFVLPAVARAAGSKELGELAEHVGFTAAALDRRVDALRGGVGSMYADAVHALLPAASEVVAAARRRGAAGFAGAPKLERSRIVKGLRLVGAEDRRDVDWYAPFTSRTKIYSGMKDKYGKPAPMTAEEIAEAREVVASVIDDYHALNHAPGFTGYLRQMLCALESDGMPSARTALLGIGMRGLFEKVAAEFGGPAPSDKRRLVFRADGEQADVLVGRFADERSGDVVAVVYANDTTTSVRGASLFVALPQDVADAGVPGVADVRQFPMVYACNYHRLSEVLSDLLSAEHGADMLGGARPLSLDVAEYGIDAPVDDVEKADYGVAF